jgi:radical SAM superfamily enzyme YgiQ (UPF0313 family)
MKKGVTSDPIRKAFRMIKKAKIACSALIIIGYPGETFSSFNETLHVLKEINPNAVEFYTAIPIVGTELYDICSKKGYITNNNFEDWVQMTGKPVISTDSLKPEDLLKLRRKAYLSFYLRLSYVISAIKNIRSIQQVKFILRGSLAFFSLIFPKRKIKN